MVLVFWISVVPIELTLRWAAYRIVASLVIGAAALAPLLAGEAWLESQSSGPTKARLGRADTAADRSS
jgi:hypothetical protein